MYVCMIHTYMQTYIYNIFLCNILINWHSYIYIYIYIYIYYIYIVVFKETVLPKMTFTENRLTLFVFFHQNRFGEIQHNITWSPMDTLQWMGAIRMRVQTADKNITAIHTTPVHHLICCELKSCMFVRNKSTNKSFNSQHHFCSKYP